MIHKLPAADIEACLKLQTAAADFLEYIEHVGKWDTVKTAEHCLPIVQKQNAEYPPEVQLVNFVVAIMKVRDTLEKVLGSVEL